MTTLVGRRAELDVIEEVLAALSDEGAGGVLQVAGEPGIGKSRLLDELRAQAQTRSCLVLAGRAAEFEGELPFGVFLDALDDHLVSLGPERLALLAGRTGSLLAVALPAFGPMTAASPPVLTEERYRTHRAVRSLLSAIAEQRPLVLVLDDLHWADAGSVELVSHLLAHPPLGAVLLVTAFRPAQLSRRLESSLAARLRVGGAQRLDLAPLARNEAYELLGSALATSVRDRLVQQGGGNPLFLKELARGAARPSTRRVAMPDIPDVPHAVRIVLRSEVASLSISAQVLLQGAAVAGDPFEDDLAIIAAGMGRDEAVVCFDELLQAGLVNLTGTPGRSTFRHPLVRAAVYQAVGRAWGLRAHARVAEAMASRGDLAIARAHHIARSASQGDAGAVAALTEAGHALAARAPATAAEWYQAATRLLAPDETAVRRIPLLIATATALGNSGSLERSAMALGEILDLLGPDDPGWPRVVAYCAGIDHLLGRHRQARARLLDAYHSLPDRASREGVALTIQLASACALAAAGDEGRTWAEEAVRGSRILGDQVMEAAAAAQLSACGYQIGLPAAAELSVAVDLADALDDEQLASQLGLALTLSWVQMQNERYADSLALCERALTVSRATGQGAYLAGIMSTQAWALIMTGRLAEAKTVIDGVIEAVRLSPNAFLPLATGFAAILASWTGDPENAIRLGEESLDLARRQDPGGLPSAAGFSVAVAFVEIGQFERAKAVVFEMCGGPELARMLRATRVIVCEVLTRADLAVGRHEAARRWAEEAAATARDGALAVESAIAARARALVLAAGGGHDAAGELALRAADRAEAAGSPIEAARCRIVAGRSFAHADERDRGVALLEDAEERLTLSGAFTMAGQAAKELRRLGRRVTRRPGPAGPVGGLRALTERERELAVLVAQGRSNRQIAIAAFLSEKTVERHLSHIFAKLGVTGRAGLAAAVAKDKASG